MIPSRSPLSAPLRAIGVVGIGLVCVAVGYGFGSREFVNATVPSGEGHVFGQGSVSSSLSEDADFATFWDVWKLVKSAYVDQPVSEKALYYGSIAGMVSSLNDPYSTYFTPEDAQAFQEQLSGIFYGIGAQLDTKDGNIVVIAPLPGTPAERQGLRTDDVILAVDGTSTEGMAIDEAVSRIRGERGTAVVLTVLSTGDMQARDVSIVRDEITIDSVTYTMRDDAVAVVEISMFNDDTSALFSVAAERAISERATGMILDLRNNPGGLLESAIDLAGYWLPSGDPAVIEAIGDARNTYPAHGDASLGALPTVVLVDGGSASASEILAGALQDAGKAVVLGEVTFGKGSVQEYHELPDGGAVKITVAKWFTPNGRSIDAQGIAPDRVVEFTENDAHAQRDPQLDAAIDLLSQE
jgi:carboxyl-terminal processing protease